MIIYSPHHHFRVSLSLETAQRRLLLRQFGHYHKAWRGALWWFGQPYQSSFNTSVVQHGRFNIKNYQSILSDHTHMTLQTFAPWWHNIPGWWGTDSQSKCYAKFVQRAQKWNRPVGLAPTVTRPQYNQTFMVYFEAISEEPL